MQTNCEPPQFLVHQKNSANPHQELFFEGHHLILDPDSFSGKGSEVPELLKKGS